jgi:hypothetical protein
MFCVTGTPSAEYTQRKLPAFADDLVDPGEGLTIAPDGSLSHGPGVEKGGIEPTHDTHLV